METVGPSTTAKKGRKAGRIVPSRYQQAAQQKSLTKGNASNVSTFKGSETILPDQSLVSLKGSKFTSTPAPGKVVVPDCDESVITAEQSLLPKIGESYTRLQKPNFRHVNKTSIDRNLAPVLAEQKRKNAMSTEQTQQLQLDLCYGKYLQAVYLESRSKKALERKTDNAMKNLHKMWSINQSFLKQKKSLSQELSCIKYLKQLKEFCRTQKQFYEQTNHGIHTAMSQYEQIGKAIETIRNRLQLCDINFPENSFEKDQLFNEMQECGNILSSILNSFPQMTDIAHLLKKFSKLRENVELEVDDLREILSELDQLVLHENFLLICSAFKDW